MRNGWGAVTFVIVLLVGCTPNGTPPAAPAPQLPEVNTPPSSPPPAQADQQVPATTEKPAADAAKKTGEENPPTRTMDDFGLPLVIEMEVPEPPEEIRGPSPPIKD